MRFSILSAAVCVALSVSSGAAMAQTCILPTAPVRPEVDLSKIVAPPIPGSPACDAKKNCKDADVKRHNEVIAKYNAEIDRINAERIRLGAVANSYVGSLNDFQIAIKTYAECERAGIVATVGAKP